MTRLEEVTLGAVVRGLTPEGFAKVVGVERYGDSIKVVYEDSEGAVRSRLVSRDEEFSLELARSGGSWSFDSDGELLRLVSEAMRIRLAYLFDPYLAIHTSRIEPLPHQITAVYEEMLKRQPLRFLLADDPGAGKTIMTGLLVIIRGDPSSLSRLSSLRVFRELLLSLPFPSAFLGCSGVLSVVEENGLEEILVGVCRLLGETPAGLLSSSGLIDLLSPNIQEVVMPFRGYLSCLLDDHSGSPPLSHIASGKNFPFPFPNR